MSRVVPGGPAQKAGIMSGDRLISVSEITSTYFDSSNGANECRLLLHQ